MRRSRLIVRASAREATSEERDARGGLATMLRQLPLLVGIICLLLSPGMTLPAEPLPERGKLTLDQCVRAALDNQPALQARQAGVGVAAEQQKVARSYFFPQAGVAT